MKRRQGLLGRCSWLLLMSFLFVANMALAQSAIYQVSKGEVRFYSEAPQELIKASSEALRGVVDIRHRTFSFKVGIASFAGFNSPLQKEHFHENYMETSSFPEASFNGKIIEDVDLTKDGTYNIRAKGKFTVHGIPHERIIKATVTTKDGKMKLHSDFIVSLADHDIKIPRVVTEKLAPDINVSVQATLVSRK